MEAITLLTMALPLISRAKADERSQVPAMFVFGDSLNDPGNNNRLISFAKANYYPNGIDFPGGLATGRFCNGGTSADHLGSLLGLPLIPPFNDPKTEGPNIIHGVNFASTASGILNETGKLYGDNFEMDKQIKNFKKTKEELNRLLGENVICDFLTKSLLMVEMGSNDYINNYMLPFSEKPIKFSPDAFAQLLIQEYTRQLMDLYNLGGRKFLIVGQAPFGCIPHLILTSGNNIGSCDESKNQMAMQFNSKLRTALQELNSSLQGSNFLYWDTYTFLLHVLDHSSHYGFKYTNRGCCGVGRSKGEIMCLPMLPPKCVNRAEYIFWDGYHPTDAFNIIAAKDAYQGTLQSTFPMNVQQLVQN